jgi:hypothetical protein
VKKKIRLGIAGIIALSAAPSMALANPTGDKCMVWQPQRPSIQFWIPCAAGFFKHWWAA